MTRGWFAEAFGALYLDVYAHRDDASAVGETRLAVAALPAGGRVLDAGCGAGRHARALAAAGLDVTGTDLSEELLAVAVGRGSGPSYVRGDVRSLPFRTGAFDGVTSFFTSFGYFDDEGNARHAAELRRVVRTRGTLLLDFLNADHVRRTLVPRSERDRGGHHIVEERAVRGGRVEKDVTVSTTTTNGDAHRSWRESVRLYDRAALVALLSAAGFAVRSVHGDLAGAPATRDAPRCVVVAEAV